MKPYQIPLILAALLPSLAQAQVTVNSAALAQLAGIAPPPPAQVVAPMPPPVRHVVHHHRVVVAVVKPVPVTKAIPAVAKPAPIAAAVVVPPAPSLAAPAPKPVAPPHGLTVDFAPGSAALPASTRAALKPFCESGGVIGIDARAPADPNDPSIAMRLSLERALALRDALTSCGVPSQNILPRALGAVAGQNEDETVLGVQK